MTIDQIIFQAINGLTHQWWAFDWLGIFFGDYLGYLLVFAFVFLLIRQDGWRNRIYAFSLGALSVILARGIITEIIRFFYYRARPFLSLQIQPLINHDLTSSFPSGHAAAYFALALAVFYLNPKLGKWFLSAALLMGLSRIFTGVHWPSDVLVGALIGLGSALLVRKILPKMETVEKND